MNTPSRPEALAQAPLEEDLLHGEALRKALGYRTGEAFRAAIRAKRIGVPLVKIAGRRGWFARAADVARWRAGLAKDFDDVAKGETP